MADLRQYSTEILLSVIAFIFLWWVLTNSNANLGNVYLWSIVIGVILLFIDLFTPDKNPIVTFQKRKGGWVQSILEAGIAWIILLISSFVILKIVDPAKSSISSIMSATNAANPAFSNSMIINWLVVTFAIGYGETQLFARLLKFGSDRLGIPVSDRSKYSLAFLIWLFVLAVLFILYHLTAKGVGNLASLTVVGIMMAISLFLIARNNGETRSAVFVHWLANGIAGFLLIQSGGLSF